LFHGEKSKTHQLKKNEIKKRKSPSMLTPFEVRRPEAEKLQAQRTNMANNPCVITPLNRGTTIKPATISNQELRIYERKGRNQCSGGDLILRG
jgi:hypothetical protein